MSADWKTWRPGDSSMTELLYKDAFALSNAFVPRANPFMPATGPAWASGGWSALDESALTKETLEELAADIAALKAKHATPYLDHRALLRAKVDGSVPIVASATATERTAAGPVEHRRPDDTDPQLLPHARRYAWRRATPWDPEEF